MDTFDFQDYVDWDEEVDGLNVSLFLGFYFLDKDSVGKTSVVVWNLYIRQVFFIGSSVHFTVILT